MGKRSKQDIVFDSIIYFFISLIAIICLFPFIYILNNSLSDPQLVVGQQIFLIPKGIQFNAYRIILQSKELMTAYKNTIIYTVAGTVIGTFVTLLCAYPLSRPNMIFRKQFTVFFLVTMYFSGGIVPTFIMMNKYGLYNTRLSIILPAAFNCYNMIIAKTFIRTISEEIIESTKIDGANDIWIFFKIIVPLCKPVIAVIAMYNAVYMWNVYFNAILYISSNELHPLQVYLNKMMTMGMMGGASGITSSGLSLESSLIMDQIKYPAIIITIVPILFVYPLVQKHFVKGMMIGSIK